jgi:thiamine biosynthesis protein ThiS
VLITLNGEPYEIEQPMTIAELLARLDIDPRRVAVEHNLEIVRRPAYPDTLIHGGDRVEIVNFVGGGAAGAEGAETGSTLRTPRTRSGEQGKDTSPRSLRSLR